MSTIASDHIYFNAFNLIPQIGPVRFRKLLNFFSNLEAAWQAPVAELLQSGLEENVVNEILRLRRETDIAAEFAKLEAQKISLITIKDQNYPTILREIANPPAVLYVRGEMKSVDETAIAIVGTRKISPYGKRVTEDLTRDLVRANITVVSGLAFGVDSFAHRTAVETAGRTIAVLACGVDTIYPAANRLLAEQILAGHGAILSEQAFGTPPLKHHFPARNRIIAGLSLGTVVIEAATDSGALITARHALEQNRQVFAVPGSIYNDVSAGPNNLLKMGAKPVTSAVDILEDLNLDKLTQEILSSEIIAENEEEQKILNILTRQPLHFDQIAKTCGLPTSRVASTLTIMEMKGKVRNLGANQYVLSR